MPLWYLLAPWLSVPVFYLAGEACSNWFHWVVQYERTAATGMLTTDLRVVAASGARAGVLAPVVDYRLQGYGVVMLWSMLLASRPVRLWGKLLWGTAAITVLQAVGVGVDWLNAVVNRSGLDVLARTRVPDWFAEAIAFYFHFNLFVLTSLAPVLLWALMHREFVVRRMK